MDKTLIRFNASIIGELLNNNCRWLYEDLRKASGLTDTELGAALGWLACQNKIDFETQNNQQFFFLNINVYIG